LAPTTRVRRVLGGLDDGQMFRLALALVLVVALLGRLAVVEVRQHNYRPLSDALDYDRHAVSIATGHGYPQTIPVFFGSGPTAFRPPAFPYFLAGVYKVSGTSSQHDRWTAGLIAGALMGMLSVALIALLALEVWGRRVALVAAALAAVYLPFISVGTSLLSESIFIPFELGAALAALRYRRAPHRYRWAIAAGALCGLAVLTRSNGLYLLLPIAIALWSGGRRLSWRELAAPAVAVACAALTVAPWTIRNAVVMHSFIPVSTQDGLSLAGTYNESARTDRRHPVEWRLPIGVEPYRDRRPLLGEVSVNHQLRAAALKFIRKHPFYPLKVASYNTVWMLGVGAESHERFAARTVNQHVGLAVASIYAFIPVALLAVAGAFTAAARRAPLFLWLIPVLTLASVMFIAGSGRYRLPADPFLILLASLALTAGWDRLRRRRVPAPPADAT
jgi:4-amino-4-deoxy-L-arabinose transferase-like glycosyltransferase